MVGKASFQRGDGYSYVAIRLSKYKSSRQYSGVARLKQAGRSLQDMRIRKSIRSEFLQKPVLKMMTNSAERISRLT